MVEHPTYLQKNFTPLEGFELFFDEKTLDYIVECTNEFALEKDNKSFVTTKEEIHILVAIIFFSGYNVLSTTRMYWESVDNVHNKTVSKAL